MAGALAAVGSYGVQAERVRLDSASYNRVSFGDSATCAFTLATSGTAQGALSSYAWKLLGNASDYDVYASLASGSLTGGTLGVWMNLGTTREWYVERSHLGSKTATINLQIRDKVTLAVLATATVTLTAQVQIVE